jgi:hypothetical protein
VLKLPVVNISTLSIRQMLLPDFAHWCNCACSCTRPCKPHW